MPRLSRRTIADLARYSVAELDCMFAALDRPANRVKSGPYKGCIKQAIAKRGDIYLAEIARRRKGQPIVDALTGNVVG